MPLAWAWAGVASGLLALAVGWLVLRLRGHYFAIASLAILIMLRTIAPTGPISPAAGWASTCPCRNRTP